MKAIQPTLKYEFSAEDVRQIVAEHINKQRRIPLERIDVDIQVGSQLEGMGMAERMVCRFQKIVATVKPEQEDA